MGIELSRNVGEMKYDNLITDTVTAVQVRGGVLRKLDAEAELKRGTVLAKSDADNKLVILGTEAAEGETLTPYCILCDATDVGTDADEVAEVYTAGCFNTNEVTVKNGYTMTEKDMDELRKYGIVFKAAQSITQGGK